jgi:protein associated with RNAse G/E
MDAVDVVLRKYNGRPHRWVTARRLGEDEYGVWLGTPAGTTVHYQYGNRPTGLTRHDAVRLIPRDEWWIAMFTAAPSEREVYCDICLPPRWTGPFEITVIDMDLDVARFRPRRRLGLSSRVVLEDEDEFAENALIYGYPTDVVVQATAVAENLRRALTSRVEPFGTASRSWLRNLATR